MNDHEKNSLLCGHLLVAWALGLNAVAMFTCPGSFRQTHLIGVVLAALALFCAWVADGRRGAAKRGDGVSGRFVLVHSLAGAAFTFLSWLALVVGIISRG